jgi:hypothetical protein
LQPPLARHIKDVSNWVVWRWIRKKAKDGELKWTKPPFIATAPDRNAKNNDPSTWRSHDQACTAWENNEADGIGFCLLGTKISAFDIDKCRNPETMEIAPYAMKLVERANSYTEITPSGTGLRIIGTGSDRYLHRKINKVHNTNISVEVYRNCERYITISNLPLGQPKELANIDRLLDEVVEELAPTPPPPQGDDQKTETAENDANGDEETLPSDLLALIRDGVPDSEDRSAQFHRVVKWLKKLGWPVDDIITLLDKYPGGIANKYDGRLAKEVRRSYGKPDQVDPYIAKLNESFALVIVGDTTVILKTATDDIGFLKVSAFKQWHANQYVTLRNDKKMPLGEYWLTHQQRRQYEGITFSPGHEVPGHFNLWRGFSVEPKPGDCSKFLAHIRDNVCCGNENHFRWVMGWFADIVQHPDKKSGTSLVLRGEQGTGKTKVGEVFGSLFNRHYLLVSAPHLITGRFNSHHVSCLLLHADEGFWAGDHAAEGKLKDLITGDTQWIEFKGKDLIRVRNYIRLLVTGNSEWLVPAGFGERRFATFDMGRAHEKDIPYFIAIDDQMDNGGREALLHYLLNFDLTTVDLRTIPKTEALFEQQVSSLTGEQSWWLDTLMRGELPRGCDEVGRCPSDSLFDRYINRATRQGVRRRSIEVQLGSFLKKHVPGLRKIKGNYQRWNGLRMVDANGSIYIFPPLKGCREAFTKKLQQPTIDWGEDADMADWTTEPSPDPLESF